MTTCTACGKEIRGLEVFGSVREPVCWDCLWEYGDLEWPGDPDEEYGREVMETRYPVQEDGLWAHV